MPADLVRALLIAALATAGAWAIRRARLPWSPWVLALWWCTPPLLTAYAWALLPGLIGPWPHLLHGLLAGFRCMPVAACAAWAVAPAPLSPAGLHAAGLAGMAPWRRGWWALSRGESRRWLVALLVTATVAFAEFELASRLAVGAWAVRLFDAQAGGTDLQSTLVAALPGIAVQLAMLGLALLLIRGRGEPAEPLRARCGMGLVVLGAGTVIVLLAPLGVVLIDAARDWRGVVEHLVIGRALVATLVFATGAAIAAWLAAGLPWIASAAVPGLAGSLVVGLTVATVIRLPSLDRLIGTPIPLLIALTVLLLPAAVVGRALVAAAATASGRHAAALLASGTPAQRRSARILGLDLGGRTALRVVAALGLLAAGDCAASAILAPADMGTALPLLYNFMHYGRSPALSGRLLVTVATPLVILAAGELLLAAWSRWCRRG